MLYELRLLVSAYEDVVRSGIRLLNQKAALTLGHRDKGKNAVFIGALLKENIELYRRGKRGYEQGAYKRKPRPKHPGRVAPVQKLSAATVARREGKAD